MLGIILATIVVSSSMWVYIDATKNKIGKVTTGGGMLNMAAGGWAVVTLLLWVIGFPAYLVKRGSLIEKAKQTPVEVTGRSAKIAVLGIVGSVWILAALISFASGDVPACNAPEVVALATQVIEDVPENKLSGIEINSLSLPAEINYDTSTEIRSCRAQLSHTLGDQIIHYTVQWHDKAESIIYVEIVEN